MAMSGIWRRTKIGIKILSSEPSPELEMAMTQSSLPIMPRSPWAASPACTKNDCVPVLAKVEAILVAIWPDLPTPVKITLPLVLTIISHARAKFSSMVGIRSNRHCASSCKTRIPAWMQDLANMYSSIFSKNSGLDFNTVSLVHSLCNLRICVNA